MHIADSVEQVSEPRREALLEAAVSVFARYGFRKTSMDEVARAAGVSRQGLYLHFADKEELFRKAVEHKLSRQLSASVHALADERLNLETRLVTACDEWAGRFVGVSVADEADLMCASTSLAGATLSKYEAQFEEALARAVGASPLAASCTSAEMAPAEVARALHATARGLKQCSQSRDDFVRGISVAAQLFCAALQSSAPQ